MRLVHWVEVVDGGRFLEVMRFVHLAQLQSLGHKSLVAANLGDGARKNMGLKSLKRCRQK